MIKGEKKQEIVKIAREKFIISRFVDDYFGIIVVSLCVLVIGVMIMQLVLPRYKKAVLTYQEVKGVLDAEERSLDTYRQRLTEYKKSYMAISEVNKEKIKEVVGVPHKYLSIYRADLLVHYDELFKDYGYQLSSIAIDSPSAPPSFSKEAIADSEQPSGLPKDIAALEVRLSIENINYLRLKELVSLLETELRIADIKSISCGDGLDSCDLVFDTYFLTNSLSVDTDEVK